MNDIDEIERELKRIQVLRERLALEKELERHAWKLNTIGAAKGGIEGIGRFVGRWWKWAAIAAVLTALAFGVYEMIEVKKDEARMKYRSEKSKFVDRSCGEYEVERDFSEPGYRYNRHLCEKRAENEFINATPPPN